PKTSSPLHARSKFAWNSPSVVFSCFGHQARQSDGVSRFFGRTPIRLVSVAAAFDEIFDLGFIPVLVGQRQVFRSAVKLVQRRWTIRGVVLNGSLVRYHRVFH